MLTFRLWSDLHLEVGEWEHNWFDNSAGQVLILAGDIVELRRLEANMDFFKMCSKSFDSILYVPGNHEFWNTYLQKWNEIPSVFEKHGISNIVCLYKNSISLGNIDVTAGTLWYDARHLIGQTIRELKNVTNDFKYIGFIGADDKWQRFYPRLIIQEFDSTSQFIKLATSNNKQNLVITHHAPSLLSHDTNYPINDQREYCSDIGLEDIKNNTIWVHGHVHQSKDYKCGNVRVICNPRGYQDYDEINPQFDPQLTFTM